MSNEKAPTRTGKDLITMTDSQSSRALRQEERL
jgi:hypothetical protein